MRERSNWVLIAGGLWLAACGGGDAVGTTTTNTPAGTGAAGIAAAGTAGAISAAHGGAGAAAPSGAAGAAGVAPGPAVDGGAVVDTDAGTAEPDAGTVSTSLTLTSSAVKDGQRLPDTHRCVMLSGATGPSPALSWTAGPSATSSYALTLTDIENSYAHWTLYDIPATVIALPEGVAAGATLTQPAGAKQAQNQNSFVGGPGYFGPCASGSALRKYAFTVYALDTAALAPADQRAATVRAAITAHTLSSATLTITSSAP